MINWLINHPLLTLIWLISGFILWAWVNFNIEVTETRKDKQRGKYLALLLFPLFGPTMFLIALLVFCSTNSPRVSPRVRWGFKFD